MTEIGTCQAHQEEQMDVTKRQSGFSKYNIFLCVIVIEMEFLKKLLILSVRPDTK